MGKDTCSRQRLALPALDGQLGKSALALAVCALVVVLSLLPHMFVCLQHAGVQDVLTSRHHVLTDIEKAPYIASLKARGQACFDAEFYLVQYPDLGKAGVTLSTAWEHFVNHGQFESRIER